MIRPASQARPAKIDALSALLSLAMAQTPAEVAAARMAILTCGGLARRIPELEACHATPPVHSALYGCPVGPAPHGMGHAYVDHKPLTLAARTGILTRRVAHAWTQPTDPAAAP